ncbi:helix-turn-helix domain-containing protein [Kordia sp.]|uniref:helix-turn-helix domain-containing protein n=1 Tax=Kordia sp. TaxID=1965332 RepID=UPI003B5CF1D9
MSPLLQKMIFFFEHLLSANNDSNIKTLQISEDTILTIMEKLSDFENNKGFLKQISLNTLAKKLGTNPKYLSKIINNHYEKNFSSYINDLRIKYLIKELKTDGSLKKLTIKDLGKKSGFGNTESFSKSFKKYTGVTPSSYLSTLKS